MSAPLIAFLCGRSDPPSRPRFEAAVREAGARFGWLDPHEAVCGVPDVAVVRNGGLTSERALQTVRTLESLGVPCLPGSAAIALAADKLAAYHALAASGVPTPVTLPLVERPYGRLPAELPVGFPVVAKPRRGMQGEGVLLVRDAGALDAAATALGGGGVVQPFVAGEAEVRVIVVDGAVLGAVRRTAAPGEFRGNAYQGASVALETPDSHVAEIALSATAAIGLDVAGVDLIRGEGGWSVIEVNSAPGFEAFEAATGVDVAGAIVRLALSRAGAVA